MDEECGPQLSLCVDYQTANQVIQRSGSGESIVRVAAVVHEEVAAAVVAVPAGKVGQRVGHIPSVQRAGGGPLCELQRPKRLNATHTVQLTSRVKSYPIVLVRSTGVGPAASEVVASVHTAGGYLDID